MTTTGRPTIRRSRSTAGYTPPGATTHEAHYTFSSLKPQVVDAHADHLSEQTLSRLREREQQWGPTVVGFGDAERALNLQSSRVVVASFDREAVVTSLTDEGYEQTTDGETFDVYAADQRAVGVGEDHLVVGKATLDVDAAGAVEATVDAWQGGAERYPEANEHVATLLERLGDGTLVSGTSRPADSDGTGFDPLEGDLRANGTRVRIDGDHSAYLGVSCSRRKPRRRT